MELHATIFSCIRQVAKDKISTSDCMWNFSYLNLETKGLSYVVHGSIAIRDKDMYYKKNRSSQVGSNGCIMWGLVSHVSIMKSRPSKDQLATSDQDYTYVTKSD